MSHLEVLPGYGKVKVSSHWEVGLTVIEVLLGEPRELTPEAEVGGVKAALVIGVGAFAEQ